MGRPLDESDCQGHSSALWIPLPALSAPIAHDHPVHPRCQQIAQPLRLGPFLKRNMDAPRPPPQNLDQHRLLRQQDAPNEHPPTSPPRTDATVVAWWTSSATYLVVDFLRAAPCCEQWRRPTL